MSWPNLAVVESARMKATRPRAVLVALMLPVLLGAAAPSSSPLPPKPDLRGTQQPLVFRSIPNAEELRRDAQYQADRAADLAASRQAERAQERNDIVTDVIGGATVLILIVQAIAFFRQTREMGESVEEMKAATAVAKQAAEMAMASADAAVDANRLNREALIADHRPWVFVYPDPTLFINRAPNGRWAATLSAKVDNTGKTPAHNVRLAGRLTVLASLDDIEREHFVHWRAASAISPGPTAQVCFPNYNLQLEGTVQISQEFQDAPLPDIFVLSACVSYAFPLGQSRHITTLLYKVHVTNSDAKAWWNDGSRQNIHFSWLRTVPMPCGWVAE